MGEIESPTHYDKAWRTAARFHKCVFDARRSKVTAGQRSLPPRAPLRVVYSQLPLAVGATSFAMCFATWRLIGAFASTFRQLYKLTATQAAFLIAVPVLLGLLAE
jgi:hypothetical protein